jgi:septal ring factor EnvC (AmiA/AmiB activator)
MASKVKAAAGSLERILLPRLNSIDGELKAINIRIDSKDTKIDGVEKSISESDKRAGSFRGEFRAELKAMNSKLEAKIDSVLSKVDHIDQQLDIDRRVTIIEAKMKELEKRS